MSNQRTKQSYFFILIFVACAAQWGCEEQVQPAISATQQMSSNGLFKNSLRPTPRAGQGRVLDIQLPEVREVQVLWHISPQREMLVRMYRDGKHWWAVHQKGPNEAWGYALSHAPISRILRSLRRVKPSSQIEFAPENPQIQLSLFAANKRFLMRILQAPYDRGPTAIHHGEWLIYHHGNLYQQPARGALGRSVPRLKRLLRELRSRRDGILLPMHSASMDFRHARRIAQQLHKQRMALRRCFKKRRFPASIGPLRMQLTFTPEGTVSKRRILTRAHTKHKVVWCVWWFAKKFKISRPGFAALQYQLVIPPGGP